MDFLLSWPTWAIMALIGALVGAIGGLIAWSLRNRFKPNSKIPQIIVGIAVAFGIGFGSAVVVPALADSDAAACRAAEAGSYETNRTRQGTRIDEVTTLGLMTVDCAAKSVTYGMTISLPRSQVTAAQLETVRQAFNSGQCANPVWREYIDDSWTIANVYTFQDGARETMTAACTAAAATTPPVK